MTFSANVFLVNLGPVHRGGPCVTRTRTRTRKCVIRVCVVVCEYVSFCKRETGKRNETKLEIRLKNV